MCSKLQKVKLSDNVTTINIRVFQGCSNLKKISIGKGTTSINQIAFWGINNFELDISDESGNYDFYAIRQFQDNDNPVLIKVEKKYNLEEGENYEIVLYGVKEEEKTYTQNEIFENFEIQDIKKTDKTGLDQIQDL